MKPSRTGLAKNRAMNPSRMKPPMRYSTPTNRERAAVRTMTFALALPATTTPTDTAEIEATVALGPTNSWRELPKTR